MKYWEKLVFILIGKIVALAGGVGVIVTMMFDKLARGLPPTYDWLQLTGICAFMCLTIFGVYADVLLNDTVKPILEESVGKI